MSLTCRRERIDGTEYGVWKCMRFLAFIQLPPESQYVNISDTKYLIALQLS